MRVRTLTITAVLFSAALGACSSAEIEGMNGRTRELGASGKIRELPQGAAGASGLPGLENLIITPAAPVVEDRTALALGLKVGMEPRGPAVSFSTAKPIPIATLDRAQFQIPFTGAASAKLVILFRLLPKEGEDAIVGVIPNTYLDIDDRKKAVAFKPRGMGDYQVAYTDEVIVKPFTSLSPKMPPVFAPILEVLGKIAYTNFFGIEAAGDTVYLIGNTGLRVVSIANPAAPVQIGLLNNAGVFGDGRSVRLSGGLLIQTTNEGGYGAFNITSPTAPTFRGGIGDAQGRDMTIVGQRGFGATSQGMRVFTFQNTMALEVLVNQTGGCTGVEGDATLVVFACAQRIIGIQPGLLPGTLNTVVVDALEGGTGVTVDDGYAYVAGPNGLRIYDILNPTAPLKVGELAIPGALQVAARGSLAIVLTAREAIAVDIANKAAPALITSQESSVPIMTGRRVKFLSPDRALILDSTGLSVLSVRPKGSAMP